MIFGDVSLRSSGRGTFSWGVGCVCIDVVVGRVVFEVVLHVCCCGSAEGCVWCNGSVGGGETTSRRGMGV